MSQYFAMGGYAAFIWPSYALGALLLIAVFVLARRRLDAATRALEVDADEEEEADPAA
jgi:heme exporter protein D